jgi:hypothetical protein
VSFSRGLRKSGLTGLAFSGLSRGVLNRQVYFRLWLSLFKFGNVLEVVLL